jgi:hypothetical protein
MNMVVTAAEEVLKQGLSLLANLDSEQYAFVEPEPFNVSIGQHYRHVLDHFLCLASGVKVFEINYDKRARNPRLETDIHYARAVTLDLIQSVRKYDYETLSRPCSVLYSTAYGAGEPTPLVSVVERELAYCAGHAVHHYAIIKLLCSVYGVSTIPEFGVAPSSMKHLQSQAAN